MTTRPATCTAALLDLMILYPGVTVYAICCTHLSLTAHSYICVVTEHNLVLTDLYVVGGERNPLFVVCFSERFSSPAQSASFGPDSPLKTDFFCFARKITSLKCSQKTPVNDVISVALARVCCFPYQHTRVNCLMNLRKTSRTQKIGRAHV